jgi:hypothetical protein
MADGIVIGGKLYPVVDDAGQPVSVRRWNDRQLPQVPEFGPGDGYNKRRVKPIDLFVFHWTGGENDPIPMADVLRKRKLGIEFAISRSGTIYQFCDPALVDTADAGIVNSRSIGCEIVCYGYASWDITRRVFTVPKLGQDREMYEALTHGKKVKTAKFYDSQMRAARALANAVSEAIPAIRKRVPSVMNDVLPADALQSFTGFVGHYHITESKRDPGPWFMEQLFSLGNV